MQQTKINNNVNNNNVSRNISYICHIKNIMASNDQFIVTTILMNGCEVRFVGAPKFDIAEFAAILATYFPLKSYYGPKCYTPKQLKEVLNKVYHNFALVQE